MSSVGRTKIAWEGPTKRPAVKTSLQIFHYIYYNQIILYEKLVGTNYITDPDFKPYAATYFWVCLNLSLIPSTIYTLVAYDFETKCKCACTCGLVVQGLAKYIVLLMNAAKVNQRVKFLEHVYTVNSTPKKRTYAIVQKFALMVFPLFKCGVVIIIGSFAGAMIYWCLECYLLWTLIPLLESHIPFVDAKTYTGYAILTTYHLTCAFLATSGTTASDLLLIMFVVHMKLLVDIFVDHMDQLNEAISDEHSRTSPRVDLHFRNIIQIHKSICQ